MAVGELEVAEVGQRQRRRVGGVEGDPAVGAGQRSGAGPHHLTRGRQLVEHRWLVVEQPARQHERLERGRGNRAAGQLLDDGEHTVNAAKPTADVLPDRQEPGQRLGSTGSTSARARASDRRRIRRSTSASHHSLPREPGPELALGHPPDARQAAQCVVCDRHAEAAAGPRRLPVPERAVAAGVARDQVAERIGQLVGESSGHSRWAPAPRARRGAGRRPRRPRPSSVPAIRTSTTRPAAGQLGQPLLGGGTGRWPARGPPGGQRTDQPHHVGDRLPRRAPGAPGDSHCRSCSVSSMTSASSRSRSSVRPSSSPSRPGSRARAAARRSASGESPS